MRVSRIGGMDTSTLLSVVIGFALATATGFRIFIPLLALSVASLMGYVNLPENMEWIGTYPALMVFSFALLFEIASYFIPGMDNLMDVLDTPIAVLAGILMMSSVVEADPILKWTLSIIVGGAVPALIKVLKASIRGMFTIFTGGMGNIFFAIFEIIASLFVAMIAFLHLK
jgi:hypothetical protein